MELRRFSWLLAPLLCACPEPDLPPDAGGGNDDSAARPEFPIRYRTHHVDIAPGFTQPVCRGALDEIDHHIEMVAGLLDIDVQTRPTFYWFNEHAEGALADNDESCDWCRNGCDCTTAGGEVIYSDTNSMFHELTHAVVTPAWGRSDVIFSEGIAYALDGGHVVMSTLERPSEVAGGTRHGGAHFSRWLVERFGPAKLRELFPPRLGVSSTKEEVFAAVEEVYGIPFLDLEAEYYATAPAIYPALFDPCDGLPHVPWQGDHWELHATPDCDSPSIFGPRDEDAAMTVSVTLDLPELPPDHWLAVDVLPDLYGKVTRCIDAPVYDVDDPREFASDSIVANNVGLGPRPGRFRLTMPLPESGELVVRICPWNGEWPQAGEPPHACLDD
jgi:hypothetical protein